MRMQTIPPSPDFARPVWKKGEVLRHISNGKPLLVLHIFIDSCTLAVDLESHDTPSMPIIILPRDYDCYARDTEMKCNVKDDDMEWSHEPITL